ncbi:HMA2 domain-containing protein [Clostridium fallax]|uniref:Uncharacterized protein n=1 Tax=Clostridium fallax TaxID=1533 RepID=A0A1M4XAD5_9CLOT|nr:hypothetical protein [Clostridium fallax]SHE90447.1 hypothetical protein SAMN05443638_1174 [Clostridium fallax]SQB06008.1 Uncharacterised protein [Clostridium fallax]
MLDFKSYIIKHFAKVKVIHKIPGRIRLKVPTSVNIPEEFRHYDKFVVKGIKILDGIEDVTFNYVIGTILVNYDTNKVYEEKVLKWINTVIDVVIKNLKLIQQYGETNLEYVINTLEQKLKEEVTKL